MEERPESAVVRQILIGTVVVIGGGFIGILIFSHGWSHELGLILGSVALGSAAVLIPRLSRWIRARWGPAGE